MGQRLIAALREVTPVVIDFEYTTPKRSAPEPIEIAVQALRARQGTLERTARWEALIRPPRHAELTTFDINQTGITPDMLTDRPPQATCSPSWTAGSPPGPYLLVAQHAPAEARLLSNYREKCPHLARIDLLDTVRLARDLYPELPKHGLDDLLRHLHIPSPRHRHRAMADVQTTTDLFIHMVTTSDWIDLRQLRALAGYAVPAARPEQTALFG